MIKVLLVIKDQNSIDLIKAVSCYKGCKVFIADSSDKLLHFLQEENIDIIFLDLNSLYSSAFDLIFSINEYNHELPVILMSDHISLPEERELRKNKIFYHATVPLNPDEIEQVIEAAINAVPTKLQEKECYAEEIMTIDNSINKLQGEKFKRKTSRNVFRSTFKIIPNIDRRIISIISDVEFNYLNNVLNFVAKPAKRFDKLMMNLTKRII